MERTGITAVRHLLSVADTLRARVNDRRRKEALLKNGTDWNTLCSAMDVVSDTCQALSAYCRVAGENGDDLPTDAAYLLAYGVLHALYLQQDAAFWWCSVLDLPAMRLFSNEGAWARSIPELATARGARNDSTGHPVRRDKPKSIPVVSYFIVQHSLTASGFTLIQRDATGGSTSRSVTFSELIDGQMQALAEVFQGAIDALDAADRTHYGLHMNRPLTPILVSMQYAISKLVHETGPDRLLIGGSCQSVRKALQQLQAAVMDRQEPWDEQWKWEYRKLQRALAILEDYSASRGDVDDDLADVAGDFVKYATDHLMELTREIDDKYETGSEPPTG